MATIGRDYSSAARLISEHQGAAFEVNKDGSIRRQNVLEKALLFASHIVGKHQKNLESKDAKVAVALQNLYQKQFSNGSSTIAAPNLNPSLSRFFGGPKNLDARKAKQLSKVDVKESKKASTSSKAAKEIKSSKVHRIILNSASTVEGPHIPKNPQSIEDFDPPKGNETDQELRDLARDVGANKFISAALSKWNAKDVTPAEFQWLTRDQKHENLTERLKSYSPTEIASAKVAYNDALKLALREWVTSEESRGVNRAAGKRNDLVRTLEGNVGGAAGYPFDLDVIDDPKHVIDPAKTNSVLADFGLKLGEGPLAKLKNADYDYVQWARSNPVSLPPGEKSPIRF